MAGQRDDGFTLIETLVVAFIMAVLAARVTLAVGLSSNGEGSATLADEKTLKKAVETSYAQRLGGAPGYAEESELSSKRFIATQSERHDICVEQPGRQRHKVVPQGTGCATITFP